MTKTRVDLITDLMGRTGLKHSTATVAVESFIDIIKKSLRHGETVPIVRFGSSGVKKSRARHGRNPKTDDTIQVKEKLVPYFKPGSALRASVKEMKVE